MAEKKGKGDAATEAERGVTRSIVNGLVLLASISLLAAWATQGFFKLEPEDPLNHGVRKEMSCGLRSCARRAEGSPRNSQRADFRS